MNKAIEKIKQVCELGDKATQGRWEVDTGMEVITDKGFTVAYPHDEMFIDENFEDNMVFATEAANARAELKQVVEGYEAMKAALEEMQYMHIGDQPSALDMSELDYAKRCNGKIRLLAKQALKGLDDEA